MAPSKSIGLIESVSIGIGGMVGGGIFAVLGLAVQLAQGGTPIAFLYAGGIAILTSYSYAKLSVAYPSAGGTVTFMNRAFGRTVFSGGTNNLLWLSYIIMLSLYSNAFGSYAANFLPILEDANLDRHIYTSFVILFATGINYYSIRVVGRIESIAVITKLIILLGFIALGIFHFGEAHYWNQLEIQNWSPPLKLITGGMVIFVAYEGFELIANASNQIRNPERNLPLAYAISVLFVVLLYFLIALITVVSLSFAEIAPAQDYVLAEAAKPFLGKTGFLLVTIAALISTFSAINATVYGGSRVNYELAEDDELPHEFTKYFWNQPIGLLITSILTLAMANTLNLESISTSGSAGFLLIFGLVNVSNWKLRNLTHSNRIPPILGSLACFLAFGALIWQQSQTNPQGTIASLSIILLSYGIEWIFKTWESRRFQ